MGLFSRKKKKFEGDFQFQGRGPELPPLPPQSAGRLGDNLRLRQQQSLQRDLPPLPKLEKDIRNLPELPPLPPLKGEPESLDEDFPTLPSPKSPAKPMKPIGHKDLAPEVPINKAKVFVKLDNYKSIINTINQMENKIKDLQGTISKINELKHQESDLVKNWENLLNEAKAKIEAVNNKLPSPEDI